MLVRTGRFRGRICVVWGGPSNGMEWIERRQKIVSPRPPSAASSIGLHYPLKTGFETTGIDVFEIGLSLPGMSVAQQCQKRCLIGFLHPRMMRRLKPTCQY